MYAKRLPKIFIGIYLVLILAVTPFISACAQPTPTPTLTPSPTPTSTPTVSPAPTSSTPAPAPSPTKEIPISKYTMAATVTDSSYFPVQSTMAEIWSKHPRITISVESGYSGLEAINALARENFLVGYSTVQGLAQGWYGLKYFGYDGPVFRDLRILHVNSVSPMTPVVLDSINSWQDLAGKTVGLSRGTGGPLVQAFFDANGIKNVNWVVTLETDVIIEKLKRGEFAGYFGKGGIKDAMITRILTEVTNTRVIDIPKEMMNNAIKAFPGQASSVVLAANEYPRQPKEILCQVYTVAELANRLVPTDVVYEMMKLSYQYRDTIAKASTFAPNFGDWPKMTVEQAQTPLHAGVVKFLREDLGMTVPDELIPPELK